LRGEEKGRVKERKEGKVRNEEGAGGLVERVCACFEEGEVIVNECLES